MKIVQHEPARHRPRIAGVLVNLDVGYHRTGVQSPCAARSLAQRGAARQTLRFDGLFIYPGHVIAPAHAQPDALRAVSAFIVETVELLRRDGLEARIVSGGSTPSAATLHLVYGITEIHPGTYSFND